MPALNGSTAPSDAPVFDVPSQEDITLSGDTLSIVREMSQEERDALLVQTYRFTQEIAGFVRGLARAVEGMSNAGGMGGFMARQMMSGFGE